jgi:tetratricopeptide (TPR) repeat protein
MINAPRGISRAAYGFVLLGIAIASGTGTAHAESISGTVRSIDVELGNIEATVARLEREVDNPVAKSRYYPLEKRLIDARVYFDLKNYDKAAVLYLDATSNRQFATHRQRTEILFRLGYCLYRLQNYLGARDYLDKVVAAGPSLSYSSALRYLIEIGLQARGNAGLKQAVRRVGRVSNRSAETQYAYGKGLHRLGRPIEALRTLSTIGPSSEVYAPAQYYLGVVRTELKQYKKAIAAFRTVVDTTENNAELLPVRELAQMALGRLFLELKDFPIAVDWYQEISRKSKHFHTALYEMTWAYVNHEKYDKALNALEVLILTVEDEELATRANILRGRLNIMLDRTDVAVDTYRGIVGQFAPLRKELDAFSKGRGSVAKYFRWLLNHHSDAFQLGAVLSDRAINWLKSDSNLKEVVDLFEGVSYQRRDVVESERMLKQLEQALKASNRVEIFPNLTSSWTSIMITENKLVDLSEKIIDVRMRLTKGNHSPQLIELNRKRQLLRKQFSKIPKTSAQFQDRKARVKARYSELRRESFLLDQGLRKVRDEIAAMERWLQEVKFGTRKVKLNSVRQRRIVASLRAEKKRLQTMAAELTTLKEKIDQQTTSVGANDPVSRSEGGLRRKLLDVHAAQEQLLDQLDSTLDRSARREAIGLSVLRERIVKNHTRLGRLLSQIDRAVDTKVADYKRQLAAERKLLIGYRRQVMAFDRDSDRIATEIGEPLFKMAHQRLTDVVLEADLGLVDVAWQRKERESRKIRSLQEEQATRLKKLQTTMKAILEE